MKKLIILVMATLTIMGCEQFTDSYDRIEDTEFRLLDFMYERMEGGDTTGSADIAPGDTMLLTAVFSGKTVNLDAHIKEWWISFNVIRDIFGSATIADSVRLKDVPGVKYYPYVFSNNTQAMRFEIPIPKDIIIKSQSIPDGTITEEGATVPAWWMLGAMNPDALQELFTRSPELVFQMMTKEKVINAIDTIKPWSDIKNDGLPILLQYFTAPIRVWAKIHESGRLPHTIRSTHNIRYNSFINRRLGKCVPENRNPEIGKIVAYKIKGDAPLTFEDKSQHTYTTIYPKNGKLVIPVEDGYSYFVDAEPKGDHTQDTTVTMYGNWMIEAHETYWQYRLRNDEIRGVKYDDYMNIYYNRGQLIPPKDKRIKNFVFWATVTDDVINERFRPMGGTLVEVEGCFAYDGATDC